MGDTWSTPRRIEGNTFRHCRVGVALYGLSGPVSVRQNTFVDNTETGMLYTEPLKGLTISENSFLRNGGDGLVGSGARPVQVSGNRAIGNTGLGINVPADSVGDGNAARGNGNPLQCAGVVCTTR